MQTELNRMDLVSIRNLFLEEMQAFLIALEIETPEQLRRRKERIKEIDSVLELKKRKEREAAIMIRQSANMRDESRE